jgi:hypothetical protein
VAAYSHGRITPVLPTKQQPYQTYTQDTFFCKLAIVLDKIEKNEMGGARSSDGKGEARTGFWWGT